MPFFAGSGNTWPSAERVVVLGGLDGERNAVGSADIYDPLRDRWYTDAEKRAGAAASTAASNQQGELGAGAGVEDDSDGDQTMSSDDSDSDSDSDSEEDEGGVGVWKRTMIEARWGACAVVTRCGQRIDVLGGCDDGFGAALDTTESYDVGRCRFLHPLPAAAAANSVRKQALRFNSPSSHLSRLARACLRRPSLY